MSVVNRPDRKTAIVSGPFTTDKSHRVFWKGDSRETCDQRFTCDQWFLVRYKWTASGANTTSSPTDQQTTASSGCWAGQACTAAAGFGLPNSPRHAAASDDIGFHSAIGWSQPGMPCVGTKALEMNVSGRKMMNPVCCAASALRRTMPRQTPAQVNA